MTMVKEIPQIDFNKFVELNAKSEELKIALQCLSDGINDPKLSVSLRKALTGQFDRVMVALENDLKPKVALTPAFDNEFEIFVITHLDEAIYQCSVNLRGEEKELVLHQLALARHMITNIMSFYHTLPLAKEITGQFTEGFEKSTKAELVKLIESIEAPKYNSLNSPWRPQVVLALKHLGRTFGEEIERFRTLAENQVVNHGQEMAKLKGKMQKDLLYYVAEAEAWLSDWETVKLAEKEAVKGAMSNLGKIKRLAVGLLPKEEN